MQTKNSLDLDDEAAEEAKEFISKVSNSKKDVKLQVRHNVVIGSKRNKKAKRRIIVFIFNNAKKILLVMFASLFCVYVYRRLHKRNLQKEYMEQAKIINNYSTIESIDNLLEISDKMSELCYPGMGKKCSCSDPTTAKSREGQRHWLKTVRQNSDAALSSKDVDVVFLGDSITEGFKGTSYGFEEGRKEENLKVFNSLFTTEGGGKYEGLALGIAGDTSTNLLWRIQNGELPSSLNPIAIWLLIGTNDFGNTWCSPEAVLIGILRVVEELRMRNPESTIVINGLLPRSYDKKSGYVMRPNQNTPFRHDRKNKPPALWNDIVSINKQLKEYSENHKKVAYFDASDIFLMDHSRSNMEVDELQINEHLMADYLHPTALGYKLWGDAIVDFLDELSL